MYAARKSVIKRILNKRQKTCQLLISLTLKCKFVFLKEGARGDWELQGRTECKITGLFVPL
jgi:hypothetical protein